MKKQNLKRFLAVFMIGAMIFTLSACGKDDKAASEKGADAQTVSKEEKDADSKKDKEKEEKKKKNDKKEEKTEKTEKPSKGQKPETSSVDKKPTAGNNSSGSSGNGQGVSKEKKLSSIMSAILSGVDIPQVDNTTLTGDNFQSFAFIEKQDGFQGLASEALIGSIAHSVVLVRVPEGASAKSAAADIRANADPRKWICVEAEKTIVKYHKRTVLLVMSDTVTANAIAANFDAMY